MLKVVVIVQTFWCAWCKFGNYYFAHPVQLCVSHKC